MCLRFQHSAAPPRTLPNRIKAKTMKSALFALKYLRIFFEILKFSKFPIFKKNKFPNFLISILEFKILKISKKINFEKIQKNP